MSTVFAGDVGTEIVLDCGVDTTAATVRSVVARKPNGEKVTWNALQEGTNSIKHITASGDLNMSGPWKLQAYIEIPGWKGYGGVAVLTVENPL